MTDLCEKELYEELEFFQMAKSRLLYPNIFDVSAEEKPDLKQLYTPTYQIELSNKFYELAQQLEYNQNIDKAIELYQKSIELGNTDAMVALATFYIEEKKSEKYNEALQLLRTAISKDNTDAMVALANFYIDRKESEKYNEALQLLQTAISKGSVAANTALAYCYLNGIKDILSKNLEKAIELFEQSAQSGDTQAIWELCFIYSENDENLSEVEQLRDDLETQYQDNSITTLTTLKETTQLFFDFYVMHPEIENNFETATKYMLLKLNLPNLPQKQKFEQSNGQSR